MVNFCGKCGCRLDETTGLCPNCSPKAKSKSKSKVKLLFFSVALILVLSAAIAVPLSYFHIINLPILSSLFEKNSEVVLFDNEDTVYHPNIEQIEFDEENNVAYFNNLLVVYTISDLSEKEANELAKSVNGTVVGDISGSINVIQIRVNETTLNELNKKSETLMKNNKVLYAGYDYPIEIRENNPWHWDKNNPDTDRENESNPSGNDWWAEAIGAYTAWDSADSVEKIKVGILDSGYDLEHEDLQDKITFLDDYADNTEDDHGTHVAGIIAAHNNELGIRGIVDNAELICVDWSPVTNDKNSSDYVNYLSTGEYIEITKQLVENGAKVINNSWGSHVYSKAGYTEALYGESNDLMFLLQYFAVDQAGAYESYLEYINAYAKRTAMDSMLMVVQLLLNDEEDFLIVQSAGNGYDNGGKGFEVARNGFYCAIDSERYNVLSAEVRNMLSESNVTYQTIDEHIMIVGAIQNSRNENGNYKMTRFSNFGDNIDICAPGQAIYSTVANNDYDSLSGTSMAGPIVAGSIALVWSDNPNLTTAQVKRVLLDTSIVSADGVGDGSGRNYPVVNVGKAVQEANILTEENENEQNTVKTMKNLMMTGFLGMTVDEIGEMYGKDYCIVDNSNKGGMDADFSIYYDDNRTPFIFGIDSETSPNGKSVVNWVTYSKAYKQLECKVEDGIAADITFSELKKSKDISIWSDDIMYYATYKTGDISVDFEYYDVPTDNAVAETIFVSKRIWDPTTPLEPSDTTD